MWRKPKQKNRKKAFKSPAMKRQAKVGGFLAAAEAFFEIIWVNISSECPAWIGLGPFFKKNFNFMPLYGNILQANFFDLKN